MLALLAEHGFNIGYPFAGRIVVGRDAWHAFISDPSAAAHVPRALAWLRGLARDEREAPL